MSEKTQARRFNDGKLQWSLVDFESMEDMVRVLEFGAAKYEAHEWKKGMPVSMICESLLRHTFAFMKGEDLDPESGLPHLGHIQCNVMFLSYITKHCQQYDDRSKQESDD